MSDAMPLMAQEGQTSPAVPGPVAMTAGRLLATQRERAGLHLAALAAMLKVPEHKLQALEDDRYDTFDDIVFLRALASSVCRVLKMEAGPVLALLPHGAPVVLKNQQGLNARFKEGGDRSDGGTALGLPISRVTAFVVIALLAAALVIAFVPHNDSAVFGQTEPVAQAQAQDPAAPQEPVPSASPVAAVAAQAPPVQAAAGPAPAAAPAVAAPAAPVAGSAGAADQAVRPGAPQAAVPPETGAVHGGEPLVIEAHQPTWLQVRDGKGTVLTERTLQTGDRYVAQGDGPWSVVLGRADAASVTVRGQAMDLGAVARSNVARFEVK